MWKKDYTWNTAKYSCENGKYLGSTIDHSVITWDKIIEETKTFLTKRTSTKLFQKLYILLAFLLITTALLIAVSIYWIKCWAKQKHLLPHHITNNKLKEVLC